MIDRQIDTIDPYRWDSGKEFMRTPAEIRYQHDPVFASLVHIFYAQINDSAQCGKLYTPTELREACILATTMWEERHVRPIRIQMEKK